MVAAFVGAASMMSTEGLLSESRGEDFEFEEGFDHVASLKRGGWPKTNVNAHAESAL